MRWKSDHISGWGRHLWAEMEVSRVSRLAALKQIYAQTPAPAIGGLRSYGDAALNTEGRAHLATRLNKFIAFDSSSGLLRAEAGITMREILDVTLAKGWAPTALPGTGYVTLGGAIAMDVHGKDHRNSGSFSAQLREIKLLDATGKTHVASHTKKAGLFWATVAGLGQTGIILEAEIQLAAASDMVDLRKTAFETLSEGIALLEASPAQFNVAWIDAMAVGANLGRGIFESSDYSSSSVQKPRRKSKNVPVTAPKLAMSPMVITSFNALRMRLAGAKTKTQRVSFLDAQYPLDQLGAWNKLYGKDGFHQFQACFPVKTSEAGLTSILKLVSKAKAASPLVIIKRLGPASLSPLSFPQEGFTIAIDLQSRNNTAALLSKLTEVTLAHDGRVYLAKDSSLSQEAFKTMYPAHADWADTVSKFDPDKTLMTNMVRRLGVRI
ncbi:MAG: FAD-binding protein [Pseudomonadota bacterium]